MVYGKTWWGKKWLEAFTGIDEDNRLPRGRTYANTGRARNIEIQGSTITARVLGSRPKPYKVQIILESFPNTRKKKIQEIITNSPSILSALISKRLPSSLFDRLKQHNINLFPSKWRHVEAECDCPDWAVPCKHIAAVIYLICAEIDKNPFTIFRMHDCDLLDLIDDLGNGRLDKVQSIDQIRDIWNIARREEFYFDQAVLDKLDFSNIPDLSSHIIGILRGDPSFYDKNFRSILALVYKHWQRYPNMQRDYWPYVSKKIKEQETAHEEMFLEKCDNPEKWRTCSLVVDSTHKLIGVFNDKGQVFKGHKNPKLAFIHFLDELSFSLLHKLCPELRLLHMLFQFAVKLMEKSALVPQILQNNGKEIMIRWLPALFDAEVKSVYTQLCQICPEKLVNYQVNTLSKQEQVKTTIAIILSGLMHNNLPSSVDKNMNQDVFCLFFLQIPCSFTNFASRAIPNSINQWLSSLYISESQLKFYLMIEEQRGDFELKLKVLLDGSSKPVSVQKALKNSDIKLKVLSDLSLIFEYIPELEEIIDNDTIALFKLSDFVPLFLSVVPILKAIGINVVLPKSLQTILKPRLNLNLKSKDKISKNQANFLNLENLLNFDWQIAIGDKKISIEEFKELAKASKGIVRISDEYVLLDEKQIEALLKNIEKLPDNLSGPELMQAMLSQECNGADTCLDQNLRALLDDINKVDYISTPSNLKVQLRPYQERGFNWLIQNIKTGFGSILADDMGLGKTLQVIATTLYLKNHNYLSQEQRVLIVAPISLLTNWQREIEKFAPDLRVVVYHGQNRELKQEYDILITSYGLARVDAKELNKLKWLLFVIDEAQNIKNPNSQQTKAIKSIVAQHKIAMSGTPVENRLSEYWSIFDFTNKLYLGNQKQFREKYALPIEKERNKNCLYTFQKITNPFILRRLKSDKKIIADLPDKITNNRYCSLIPEQAALYQEVVDMSIKKIERTEGIERKGLVLGLINSLKQICNHPSHFSKKKRADIDQSGKMTILETILLEIDEVAEKSLIFTQYVEMGEIISKLLESRFKADVPFLHGGLSRKRRDEIVQDFQNASDIRTLIVSLKAGGTGLNLTSASHVIHYDLWWNPAVEDQATDRAYRIGQNRTVIVHRLLTTGTFEERIDEMIKSKKELANLVVSSQKSWITEMNIDQIKDLVSLQK